MRRGLAHASFKDTGGLGGMRRKIVVGFLALMFLAGIGIMLYPTVSSLINEKSQSNVIANYEEQISGLSEEEIESYLKAANEYNEWLRSALIVLTDPFEEGAQEIAVENDYYDLLNLDGDGVMGYISMEIKERDISINLPIYHGTSQTVLALGAGHLEGTSLPVGGESTHSVISAHTGLVGARMFNDLANLQDAGEFTDDDIFTITVLGQSLTYQIYSVEVVEPDNTSSLSITEGEDLVTLITCTPYGINSHRLLVHGKRLVQTENGAGEEEERAESAEKDVVLDIITLLSSLLKTAYLYREYLAVGAGVSLIALLILILIFKRRKKRKSIKRLRRQIKEQEEGTSDKSS